MADLPKTMKAWTYNRHGKPKDVLKLNTDAPLPPTPKAGDVMIRVSYVALNPADYKLMEFRIPFRYPATPSIDMVGEIVQTGPGVSTDVRIGMTVSGSVPTKLILRGVGVLAEYIVLPAHAVVEKPQGLQESVAAGLLGIAGQTSAMVLKSVEFRKDDKVLLNGASGGVGCVLIQVLCGLGVHVTAVCSARNEALVKRLGAEEVVDYTAHADLYGHLSSRCASPGNGPFDAIIDCVGNMDLYYKSSQYLKTGGPFCCIEAPMLKSLTVGLWPKFLRGAGGIFKGVMNDPSGANGKIVAEWFEKGWIKEVPVDSVFNMEEVLQAFERQATGRAAGKIFVKVR